MKVTTDIQGDLFTSMRERVCAELCPGGRKCTNLKCISAFFTVTAEMESKLESIKPEGK